MLVKNGFCVKLLQLHIVLLFTCLVTSGYACTESTCEEHGTSNTCYKKSGIWECGIPFSEKPEDKSKKDKHNEVKKERIAAVKPQHTPSMLDIICLWEPHFSCPS